MAPNMATIELRMELDVISMKYTTLGARSQPMYLMFEVVVNRRTEWADNSGMSIIIAF
jgi:hypothetical protein